MLDQVSYGVEVIHSVCFSFRLFSIGVEEKGGKREGEGEK